MKVRKYNRQRKLRKRLTRHHDRAQSLGGRSEHRNIFWLTAEHHEAYHKLFGLRTFEEAADVLRRMQILHNKEWK